MDGSLILDVTIGLVLVFAVTAAMASALTEVVARFLGLRGDYLLRGLRALVDGTAQKAAAPATTKAGKPKQAAQQQNVQQQNVQQPNPAVPLHPLDPATAPLSEQLLSRVLLSTQSDSPPGNTANGLSKRTERRSLPSYLSSSAFAATVVDAVIPDKDGTTTMDDVITYLRKDMPDSVLRDALLTLARTGKNDIDAFRASVEKWYDDQMDRVSGWYKRHTRWITLIVGSALVLVFNINTVTVARSLYTDQALRESVVTQALKASDCKKQNPSTCLTDLRKQIATLHNDGLPIGWGTVAACSGKKTKCSGLEQFGLADPGTGNDFWFFLSVLVGWIITALALTPGARFWFDLLSRLGTLRSTGPKPARS